MGIWVRFQR